MTQTVGASLQPFGSDAWSSKDKDERLDFSISWEEWVPDGDAIVSSDWSTEDGLVIVVTKVDGALCTALVESGLPGTWYALTNTVQTAGGLKGQRSIRIFINEDTIGRPPLQASALFPSRFQAIASIRGDRLTMAASGVLPSVQLSDDYIWEKLLAAESTIAGMLHCPLQPTRFFPQEPTDEQIAALPPGMPWAVDEAYDYDPANYRGDRWGFIVTRQKPIQKVNKVRFVYPAPQHVVLDVPQDWVRVDHKYGHVQFVPTSSPFLSPIGGLVMNSMAAGRQLPFAIELEYTAGLKDAARNFPELLSLVKKMAVAMIIEDAFLPSSGSISADGLSQSMSVDLGQYHDSIDRAINGGQGSNGGLMVKIHGIRMMVM